MNDIRKQGYDNGSNMKGNKQGVQKRLLNINSNAIYTPCSNHNINPVLCHMANSCTKTVSFFWSGTTFIYIIFFFNKEMEYLKKKKGIEIHS